MTKKTLDDWRETIEENVGWLDIKPFSHNIISLALGAIAREFGKEEANTAIEEFGLEEYGWHKKE